MNKTNFRKIVMSVLFRLHMMSTKIILKLVTKNEDNEIDDLGRFQDQ